MHVVFVAHGVGLYPNINYSTDQKTPPDTTNKSDKKKWVEKKNEEKKRGKGKRTHFDF
jgi:hypothetical protein